MNNIFEFIKKEIEKTRFYKFKLLVCVFLYYFLFILIFKRNENTIQNFILLITFGAIIWYSFETRELKLSSQFTNEIAQKPIIDLLCSSKDDFVLKNNGKGVAYNIKLEFSGFNQDVKFNYKFYIHGPNVILFPNEEKTLDLIEYGGDNRLRAGRLALENLKNIFSSNFNNLFGNPQFSVFYENAQKKKYQRIFEFHFNEVNKRLESQPFKIDFVGEK